MLDGNGEDDDERGNYAGRPFAKARTSAQPLTETVVSTTAAWPTQITLVHAHISPPE